MTGRPIILLSLAALVSAASLRVTDPLLALISTEFHVTPGAASAVITAFAVAYGLLQIVHGPIGDRFGKYRVVCAATGLSALGSLGCALAPSLAWLVAARLASGATVGALIPVSVAWIGDVVPYEHRQPVIARFLIGQVSGVAAGTTLGGVLGEAFGWRSVFLALSLLFVLVAGLLGLEFRRNVVTRRRGATDAASIRDAFRRIPSVLRRAWVRAILVMTFIEAVLFFGALAFIPFYFHVQLGASLGVSGSLVIAYAAGGLMYAAFAGQIVPRFGERRLASTGGTLAGIALAGLCFAPSIGLAVPCLLLAGIGLYMLHNTLQVNATQMVPEARGTAVSLFALCLFIGQSAGVWLAGRVVDVYGTRPVFAAAAVALPALGIAFRRQLARRGPHGDNVRHAMAER